MVVGSLVGRAPADGPGSGGDGGGGGGPGGQIVTGVPGRELGGGQ